MPFYGISRADIRQHSRNHQRNLVVNQEERRLFCLTCYPHPPTVSNQFTTFWNWINQFHQAKRYTGYTVAAFITFEQAYTNPNFSLADLAHITTLLIQSIRFTRLSVLITEICFYFHTIYTHTDGY